MLLMLDVALVNGFSLNGRVMVWSLSRTMSDINFSRRGVLVKAFAKAEIRTEQERMRPPKPALANPSATPEEIILTVHNGRYNLTKWADHHPGGIAVLRKFNHRNATLAYEKIGHSHQAMALLESFRIDDNPAKEVQTMSTTPEATKLSWRASTLSKLITKEDPFHVHKVLGIFCLLHFFYRYALVFSGWDTTAGFGSFGKVASSYPRVATIVAFLLPHALLSSTSLLFHTVPFERVRGKPMIWKEYRWHNMVFVFRSIVACFLATLMMNMRSSGALAGQHMARVAIVAANSFTCLATHVFADIATAKLRPNATETTITSAPFWEGCSPAAQNGLRAFYGYSQFAATMTCLTVARYPSWSFLIIFPIQLASLLMTLSRKGIISSRQSHIGYTISLLMPLAVVTQNAIVDPKAVADLAAVVGGAAILNGLRRKYHINKYALWIPTAIGRIALAAYQ